MFILLRLLHTLQLCHSYPTIIIHGIASNKHDLEAFSEELSKEINATDNKVYNMEIQNGKWTSIFMNLNQQCEIFANNINNLNITEEKINLIGFSQGGLIARCYVEKYSHKIIGVNSLITIATPNMGIFSSIINPISTIINPIKEYWKNPYKYNQYIETNDFLVYINNEKLHENYLNYKNNIRALTHFLIVWSSIDNIIKPIESSKFEFYDIEIAKQYNRLEIQSLKNSSTYNNLGLRELDTTNKLIFFQCDCKHEEFKLPKCFKNKMLIKTIVPYL